MFPTNFHGITLDGRQYIVCEYADGSIHASVVYLSARRKSCTRELDEKRHAGVYRRLRAALAK